MWGHGGGLLAAAICVGACVCACADAVVPSAAAGDASAGSMRSGKGAKVRAATPDGAAPAADSDAAISVPRDGSVAGDAGPGMACGDLADEIKRFHADNQVCERDSDCTSVLAGGLGDVIPTCCCGAVLASSADLAAWGRLVDGWNQATTTLPVGCSNQDCCDSDCALSACRFGRCALVDNPGACAFSWTGAGVGAATAECVVEAAGSCSTAARCICGVDDQGLAIDDCVGWISAPRGNITFSDYCVASGESPLRTLGEALDAVAAAYGATVVSSSACAILPAVFAP